MIESGRIKWDALVARSADLTWLWQDITGLQTRQGLPEAPPHTSILWGWTSSTVVRVRLEAASGQAFVAAAGRADSDLRVDRLAPRKGEGRGAEHAKRFGPDSPGLRSYDRFVRRNAAGSPVTFMAPSSPEGGQ